MKSKLITLSNLTEFKTKMMQTVEAKGYVTSSVNNLVNYYLKTETYNKNEVDALVAAIKQFTYESVQTLPTASASTMHKIYLVPASSTGHTAASDNVKKEFITIQSGAGTELDPYTYAWEEIGDTQISLSGYVTTSDLNTALADYVTATSLATTLEGYQTKIDSSHKLSADLLSDGSTNKVYTGTEQTKLESIENGAQVNTMEKIEVKEGSTDSSDEIAITNKKGTIVVASNSEIDALFAA